MVFHHKDGRGMGFNHGMKERILLIIMMIWIRGVFAQNTGDQNAIQHSIILIGDAGKAGSPVFEQLKQKLVQSDTSTTLVFLGDNIYPQGMPSEEHKDRGMAEEALDQQLELIRVNKGRSVVIPGNHDWAKGGREGLQHVLNQQQYIEAQFPDQKICFPGDACPGPEVIALNPYLLLVLIDTQWLLHGHDKPGESSNCGAKTGLETYAQLMDLIDRNPDKNIIVAGHHPMYTYGIHGGKSTFRQHVFPLTDAAHNFYLPLPIIGSIYPLSRKYLGHVQDVAHPLNKVVRKSLMELFESRPNIIYASGHEHSLQYNKANNAHYIVSGSGSKTSHVVEGKYAQFVSDQLGYARINYHENGTVQLQFFHSGNWDQAAFETNLYTYHPPAPASPDDELPALLHGDRVRRPANPEYLKRDRNTRLWGANYRDVWAAEVDLPVFDIGHEHGGLKIVKMGGGFQTKSLRLEADNGKQYVIRSINKYTEKAVPEVLRGSFAAEVVQDQISASHPYGAFVVPVLADAAGIYHTTPKAMLVPDDPRFGFYQNDFADQLVLYEERPSGNWSDHAAFGNSKKILSTLKTLDKLYKDNDHEVDQEFVARNRLFDLMIGDWDRHDDQWRWARLEGEHGYLFRPIPRDRDQAFFVNQGTVPKLASRRWIMPKFEGFNHEVRYVPGFMFNARYFDRSFINEADRATWVRMAKDIQHRVTDETIESALKTWPDTIWNLSGSTIASKLKSRRDHLETYANTYYEFLAKEVDVVGSNKKEWFKVQRLSDDTTLVQVYKIGKHRKVKHLMYERYFLRDETKEIRLYALKGKDKLTVEGDVKKGIKLRFIGGPGNDSIIDHSRVRGWSHKTLVYDEKNENYLDLGGESRNLTSHRDDVNTYDRKSFQYNLTMPLVIAAYNPDDGIFLGSGLLVTTHGFRKDPYKTRHFLLARIAFKTGAFDIRYAGIFNHVISRLDFMWDVDVEGPNYTNNYFGMGNESVYDQNQHISYYFVRYQNILTNALFRRRFSDNTYLAAGLAYENVNVESSGGRLIVDAEASGITAEDLDDKRYGGGKLRFEIDSRDNKLLPLKGVHWFIEGKSLRGLNDNSNDYSSAYGEFSFYKSFRSPSTVTFSNRTGGGHVFGDFEFFQAMKLGGAGKGANLRGYRKTRFYGRSSFYNNTDLRLKLFGFRTYLFPSDFGILGFYDFGRVWLNNEESDTWHTSTGFGFWLAPFEAAALSTTLSFGEQSLVTFNFGFLF